MGTDELPDDQLINESFSKNPKPLLQWLGILILIILGILGIQWGLHTALQHEISQSPFNQVTNREISVFLWQNPEFMRANSKSKRGYLPGFQYLDSVAMEPELAEQFAVAPPEVIFLYHTWRRQIGGYDFHVPIGTKKFLEFLDYAEEWKPKYWPAAPKRYVEMISRLNKESHTNLTELRLGVLPLQVRQAFIGWNNYFNSGSMIQNLTVKREQVQEFLRRYPLYSRSYWKNIVSDSYLKSLEEGPSDQPLPSNEMTAFLKQAIFNSTQQQPTVTE